MTDGLVISRFLSAGSHAKPEDTLTAPIINDDPDGYDFLTVLKTYAEHQTLGRSRDRVSFSACRPRVSHPSSLIVSLFERR